MRIVTAALFGALALAAPIQQGTFENLPSLTLANDKLELTVLLQGSTLANLVLKDDPEKLSPLWNPLRLAREAGHKTEFGYSFGHFVCVDGFGLSSNAERA